MSIFLYVFPILTFLLVWYNQHFETLKNIRTVLKDPSSNWNLLWKMVLSHWINQWMNQRKEWTSFYRGPGSKSWNNTLPRYCRLNFFLLLGWFWFWFYSLYERDNFERIEGTTIVFSFHWDKNFSNQETIRCSICNIHFARLLKDILRHYLLEDVLRTIYWIIHLIISKIKLSTKFMISLGMDDPSVDFWFKNKLELDL